jgi:hypothetical protein
MPLLLSAFAATFASVVAGHPLAVPLPPPEPTQRSPLLYAWLALQAVAVIAVLWLLVRYARTASARRRRASQRDPQPGSQPGSGQVGNAGRSSR